MKKRMALYNSLVILVFTSLLTNSQNLKPITRLKMAHYIEGNMVLNEKAFGERINNYPKEDVRISLQRLYSKKLKYDKIRTPTFWVGIAAVPTSMLFGLMSATSNGYNKQDEVGYGIVAGAFCATAVVCLPMGVIFNHKSHKAKKTILQIYNDNL